MSLFQKMNPTIPLLIFFFACNIVHGQESNLRNPESNRVGTIDFIQTSSDKGQIRVEAGLKSSESDIGERIDFIQTSFDKGQTRAKLWSYTWMVINGATTGIQAYQAISSGHDRVSNIVGASESFLGLAELIVDPFHASSSGSDLKKIPGSTLEEQKAKLDKGEKWLEGNYKQEKLWTSWLSHVGVLAVSIIGAGIVWHYEGRKNGLINGLTTVAGGELQIWTQPTRAIRDYHDYHSKYEDACDDVPDRKYFIAPSKNGFVAGIYF